MKNFGNGPFWLRIWSGLVGAAILTSPALASPILFTFDSTGDGNLGGVGFSDKHYVVSILGDTSNIDFDLGANIPAIQDLTGSIQIDSVDTATFSVPFYVFNNRDTTTVGFGDLAFFGGDYWDQTSSNLSSYGLDTSFGPLMSQGDPNLFIGFDAPTDKGELIMTNPHSQPGTFKAEVVPEPISAFVLLGGLGLLRRRRDSKVTRLFLAVPCASLAATAAIASGPTSKLYLTDPDESKLFVIQGSSIVNTFTTVGTGFVGSGESALAVSGDIRTFGLAYGSGAAPGHQYDLNGNYLRVEYPNNNFVDGYFDGATNGNANFSAVPDSGSVVRFDRNWANPQTMFNTEGAIGIAYDTSDDTLWVSDQRTAVISHFTMTGTTLSSFQTGEAFGIGLALDPADSTLWSITPAGPNGNTLKQYSKSGTFIGAASYSGLSGYNIGGAEFAVPVPEPSSLFCLGSAGFLLIRRRRCSVKTNLLASELGSE